MSTSDTEADAFTLIRTKLQRPGLPGELIPRRRLLDQVKTTFKEVLRRGGVVDRLGGDLIFGNVYRAAADRIPAEPVPQAGSD